MKPRHTSLASTTRTDKPVKKQVDSFKNSPIQQKVRIHKLVLPLFKGLNIRGRKNCFLRAGMAERQCADLETRILVKDGPEKGRQRAIKSVGESPSEFEIKAD